MASPGNIIQSNPACGHSGTSAAIGSPLRKSNNRQQGRDSPSPSRNGAAATLSEFTTLLRATAPDFVPGTPRRSVSTSASKAGVGKHVPTLGDVSPGQLVAYQRDKSSVPAVGLVVEPIGKKNWSIMTTRGQKINLAESLIAVILPGGTYNEPQMQAVALEAATVQASFDISLIELAWEMCEDNDPISILEMAQQIYGTEATASTTAAVYSLLAQHRTHFKMSSRMPVSFSPRSKAEVAAVKAEEVAERRSQQEAEAFQALSREYRAKVKAGCNATVARADLEQSEYVGKFMAIEEFAIQDPEKDHLPSPAAKDAMGALLVSATSDRAADVLRSTGWWRRHDLLPLMRTGLTPHFSPNLQEAAAKVNAGAISDTDASSRKNLCHMHVITIDDASTTEIDDGLSVEHLGDGSYRLWVHISDPTRWLGPPGTSLDLEAARRAKSVYLPTGVIPMFPFSVAEGCFSLRTGVGPVPAMSISATVDDSGELSDYAIMPSLIEPKSRLTYDEADKIIADLDDRSRTWEADKTQEEADQEVLAVLNKVAQSRGAWRRQQGAVDIDTPDVSIRVQLADNDDIQDVALVTSNSRASPSSTLVAEMMILANQAIGDFGTQEGLPLPYRGQAPPVLPSDEEMAAVPEGLCRAIALRNCMTRSVTTVEPGSGHASLGLPAYVQFTSPIRRYSDLLAHYQVKSHLRSQLPLFSAETLAGLVDGSSTSARSLVAAERSAQTYWQIQHFRLQPAGSIYRGQIVAWRRQDLGLAKVIMDNGLEVPVNIDRPAAIGEYVNLVVAICDIPSLNLTFQEIPPIQNEPELALEDPTLEQDQPTLEQDPGLRQEPVLPTAAIEAAAFMAAVTPGSSILSQARL